MKRILSLLLVAVCLVALSSSAFAREISPTATGVGDTKEKALTLTPGLEYSLYIDSSTDADWYKWTNNTGQGKFFLALLYADGQKNWLNLATQIIYADGRDTTLLYTEPAEPGTNFPAIIRNLYVPDGATVYFKINAQQFHQTEQYRFEFVLY